MNSINVTLGGAIELLLRPAPADWHAIITARYLGFSATSKGKSMAYNLPDGNLVVSPSAMLTRKATKPNVAWASSEDAIATATVDPDDSAICTISSVSLGTAQISATADADLGDGTRSLVCTLDVTVVAGEAVAGTIFPISDSEPIAPHPEPVA